MESLIIKLQNNRFATSYGFSFNGLDVNGDIVIDTGCMFTSISLNSDILPEKDIDILKQDDILKYKSRGFPKASRSIGVNDRDVSYKDINKMSFNELLYDKTVGFIHKVDNFTLGDLNLGSTFVKIVYGRPGHSLLGINILKLYDSRITNINGYTEFILDPKERVSRGLVDRCKYKIKRLFSKGLSVGEMRKSLSAEYSEECLDKAFCEIFEEHHILNYKDDSGHIVEL